MRPMKNSGIEWIGEIPEGWEITTYHRILIRRREFDNNSNKQVLSLTINGVKEKNIEENYGKMAADFTGHQIVEKGDLVFTPRDFDATPILSGIAPSEGCISNLYFVLYGNHEICLPFYNYFMWGVKWGGDIWKRLSYGMRFSYTYHQFASLPTVSISLSVQQTIADFLDKKCELIDSIIEKQKKVIEKIKSYKQSLITEAVTKGLDPTVKMKHSGIEWIGDIPEGWEKITLKMLSHSIGDGLHGTPIFSSDGLYDFINGNNLGNKLINIKSKTNMVDETEYKKYMISLDLNTLLISLNGTIGNMSFYNNESIILSKSVGFIKLKPDMNKFFIYYFLQSEYIKRFFDLSFSGTTINNLSLETLRNTTIFVPTLPEQQAIADFLDNKCTQIDKAINIKQKLIDKLTDYKKSLIYECVTGKKEVTANA